MAAEHTLHTTQGSRTGRNDPVGGGGNDAAGNRGQSRSGPEAHQSACSLHPLPKQVRSVSRMAGDTVFPVSGRLQILVKSVSSLPVPTH